MYIQANENDWLLIEQKLEPDPIDIVTALLDNTEIQNTNTFPQAASC
jgi:hypothetical protein